MSNVDWSGNPAPTPVNPWVGAPAPQPPKKSRVGLGIGLGVGAMAFAVAGVVALNAMLNTTTPVAAPDPTPSVVEETDPTAVSAGEILPAAEYEMSSRPGWQQMVDTVSGINQKYKDALADGTIVNMTPVSVKDNPDYYKDFMYILWDYNAAIPFMEMTSGTDPVELDARISALRDKALLAEQKFMKGEEFGITVKITREDGSVYESDGKLNEASDGTPLVADPEEYARTFTPETDANGTYIEAAALLSSQFGRYVSYDFQTIYDHCTGGGDDTYTMAAFCAYDPSMIYVNADHGSFPEGYSHPGFLDTIKHELAHAIIYDVCSTSSPVIAGGSVEAVTSSYAVLFLGADFDQLQSTAGSFPEYAMTEASNAVATSINAGMCR